MKKTIVASIFALSCVAANAGVFTFTNLNLGGVGDTLITAESGVIANFGVAAGGFFTAGFDVNAAVSTAITTRDFTSLVSNFTVLGTGELGGGNGEGYFFGSADYGAPGVAPSVPLLTQLYAFIGNQPTLAASTEYALFLSPDTVNADAPAPDSNTALLAIGDPTNVNVLIGTVGNFDTNPDPNVTVNTPSVALVAKTAVPEPSALLLSGLGVLALLRRKR